MTIFYKVSNLFSDLSDNQDDSPNIAMGGHLGQTSSYEANFIPPSKRNVTSKKRHGVFYTPDLASRLLAKWAIRSQDDLVLEPSFGGCGFLQAAKDRLTALAAEAPERQLYGCDIDPNAFKALVALLDGPYDPRHFRAKDYLTMSKDNLPAEGVGAIIGNPPYVSWHNMLPAQRRAAKVIDPKGTLKGNASLWAYFVLHSLNFLHTNGRMAWILPGSFLYADYSPTLRHIISQRFTRSIAILLEQRLFISEGTEESSVILLCEGFRDATEGNMHLTSVQSLDDLAMTIDNWSVGQEVGVQWDQQASRILAPQIAIELYTALEHHPQIKRLGEVAKIKIGSVTGDNNFFVLSADGAKELDIPSEALQPIVARFLHCKGLRVTLTDLADVAADGQRCLLLTTSTKNAHHKAIQSYIETYPKDHIPLNRTFKKRRYWYQIEDKLVPDAFFSCVRSKGPVLILNEAQTTCTNTIYRVWFQQSLPVSVHKQVAVSLQSTFSLFSAELEGRTFGTGSLKLEPSEASRLAVLLPDENVDASVAFNKMDACLRKGEADAARQIADQFLLDNALLTPADIQLLSTGLARLRIMRTGIRHA
ncbi:N-6 DNA methylase [Spirosoma pomorum]